VLRSLQLGFGAVNLVVGRNGAGKTTLLEAVALLLGAGTRFTDALGFNVADRVARRGRSVINVVEPYTAVIEGSAIGGVPGWRWLST